MLMLHSFGLKAATIKGIVLSSEDNSGLSYAKVSIKNTKYAVLTDIAGNFIFRGVPAGRYLIDVQFIGYMPTEKEFSISPKDTDEVINLKIIMNPNAKEIDNVTVTGVAGKETETAAKLSEKNADNIITVLSAQAIEKSPDITVANALQRVSGVSTEANQNGVYAVIRGMNKRYNSTLINGLKISSPDPKARFVPLDIIPSDLLQRIEVVKSITPDMEGDAIGGVVNVVMKDAPDSLLLNAYTSIGYNDLGFNQKFTSFDHSVVQSQSPVEKYGSAYLTTPKDFTIGNLKFNNNPFPPGYTLGATFGDRFLNNKLGFLTSISSQDINKASNGTFYILTPDPTTNIASPYQSTQRNYSINSNRIGWNNKLDYRFNENNKLVLTAILLKSTEYQYRKSIDTALNDLRTVPGTGFITYRERSRTHEQLLGNFALQGFHDFAKKLFSVSWTGQYSTASGAVPDQAEVVTNFTGYRNHKGGDSTTTPYLDHIQHLWQHNTDRDMTGMLDVYFRPMILNKNVTFKAGVLYREKRRDNFQTEYTLSDKAYGGGKAKPPYTSIDSVPVNTSVDNGSTAAYSVNDYTAIEDVFASYIQAKTSFGKLDVLTGVRYEGTYQNFVTQAGPSVTASTATINYGDILPGLHLKYVLTPEQNIRFSVNRSISRPNYYEMVPYHIVGEYYDEYGNPYLTRTEANNYDLRYEYFASRSNHFGAGLFYKDILNPIEYVLYLNKDQLKSTTQIINASPPLLVPQSLGHAVSEGFELTGIYFIGNFGASANYTYTQSSVNTQKYYYDPNIKDHVPTKEETRPLQGQSKNIGNLSIIYRNTVIGFHAQVSLVYTGARIESLSPFYGLDNYSKDMYTLDFSAEQRIYKHFIIFTKLTNLLNTPFEIQTKSGVLEQKDYYGRFLQLGLRYRFN